MRNELKIKIAFIVRSLETGGTERQVIEIISGLDKKKFNPILISFYKKGELIKLAKKKNINIIFIEKESRYDFIKFLHKLNCNLNKIKPDIVHSFLDSPNIFLSLTKLFFHKYILIWGIRSSKMQLKKYSFLRQVTKILENCLSKIPNGIVYNSYNAKNNLKFIFNNNYSVIQNGIDTDYFIPSNAYRYKYRDLWMLDESIFLIGMVARFDPKKDHENFIQAARIISKEIRSIKFVLITNKKNHLNKLINSYGLSDYFIIETGISETNKIYPAFDINTLSSAFGEGFPNVIAEGMSCEVPTVATDTGDSKEIINNNQLIAPPRDSNALANCWLNLYNISPSKRNTIGRDQRKRIINYYSKEIMLNNSEKLYKKYILKHK